MEIEKVEDHGAMILVTFRVNKRLCGYFCTILDAVSRISQTMHRRARIAKAERRAFEKSLRIGETMNPSKIRNEMILFLKENNWKVDQIAEAYELTPGNVRQILSRLKKEKPAQS